MFCIEFTERKGDGERKSERSMIGYVPHGPQLGIEPETWAYALTGN